MNTSDQNCIFERLGRAERCESCCDSNQGMPPCVAQMLDARKVGVLHVWRRPAMPTLRRAA